MNNKECTYKELEERAKALANRYGVSTDYMLGRTDLKSPNEDDKKVNSHTSKVKVKKIFIIKRG